MFLVHRVQVESYFSDIGGTLGLYLGMSLMSVVEFFELLLDLIIWAIIRCSIARKAKRQIGSQQGGDGDPSGSGGRMPWEPPPAAGNEQFAHGGDAAGVPPSYRTAARMSRVFPNEVRDVLLNM